MWSFRQICIVVEDFNDSSGGVQCTLTADLKKKNNTFLPCERDIKGYAERESEREKGAEREKERKVGERERAREREREGGGEREVDREG